MNNNNKVAFALTLSVVLLSVVEGGPASYATCQVRLSHVRIRKAITSDTLPHFLTPQTSRLVVPQLLVSPCVCQRVFALWDAPRPIPLVNLLVLLLPLPQYLEIEVVYCQYEWYQI